MAGFPLDDLKTIAEIATSLATILAIFVGGLWTYYNYFYRRTFTDRLDITLHGRNLRRDGTEFLLVDFEVKNVGLSRFSVKHEGSAVTVSRFDKANYLATAEAVYDGIADHEATFRILQHHKWIESGETVTGAHVFAVPQSDAILWRVSLVVASSHGIEWTERISVVRRFDDGDTPVEHIEDGQTQEGD